MIPTIPTKKSKKELTKFLNEISELSKLASKNTHYDKIDEWYFSVYGLVRKRLKKFKFINGGKIQNNDAKFWLEIYGIIGSITWSKYLKTDVERHHASAYSRNVALIKEIEDIFNEN